MKVVDLMKNPPFKFASGGIVPKKLTQMERERLIYKSFAVLRKCGVEVEHIDVHQDPTIMKLDLKLSCFPAFPHTLVYEQAPPVKIFDGKIDIDWGKVEEAVKNDCN